MRQTGYYFVDEIGRIAYYNGVHWTMCGTQDRYLGHTFDAVSTPITPEKMAAIESIIDTISKVDSAVDKYFDIVEIIKKNGLFPQPEKPKEAYYKGKKLRSVFNVPGETKYEIFVPHRIQVDKSEIEWKEIN